MKKILAASFALILLCNQSLLAVTSTWSGATSSNWGVGTNWSTGSVPTGLDIYIGDYAGSNNPSGGTILRTVNDVTLARASALILSFTAGGGGLAAANITSSGGEVTFRTGGTLTATNFTINNAFSLGGRTGDSGGANAQIGNINISGTTTLNSGAIVYAAELTGTANFGVLAMNGGTFNLTSGTVAGANASRGTPDGGANNITVTRLNGTSGTISTAKTGTTGTLIVDGTVDGTFDGTITAGTGTTRLTKAGTSKLTLTGTNTYTGATTINGGTLLINGSTAATSAVTVNTGGTLGGTGTVGGSVTVNSGATISPGSSIESLATGSNTWIGGGAITFEFSTNGATGSAGSQWDLLSITGGLDLTGVSSGTPFVMNLVTMSNATSAGLLTGWNPSVNSTWAGFVTTTTGFTSFAANKFSFNTSGFQNTLDGSFSVVQNGNNLDLVYTTNVPEPTTMALVIAFGVAALVFRRRAHQ